jgi:hypothetical protein
VTERVTAKGWGTVRVTVWAPEPEWARVSERVLWGLEPELGMALELAMGWVLWAWC